MVDYVNISDSNLRVLDVWKDGTWHFDELFIILPSQVKDRIRSCGVMLNNQVEDCLFWGAHVAGNYDVKSPYA